MTFRRLSSPTLVGRVNELAALRDAFTMAVSGRATTTVVGGEAGVGKTRLLTEFVSTLPEPAHVIWGRCMALIEGGLPYGAFRDGLRTFVRSLDPVALGQLRERSSSEIGHLVPDLIDGEPARDQAGRSIEQARMFELLLQTITFLATQRPLVLVIDDLHWADRSTLTLLAYLIQNLASDRVLVCATYRSDELDRTHPLRPWLAEHLRRGEGLIELTRLSRSEIVNQLEAILGSPPPDKLVDDIFARSAGNPFFAEELLAASATMRDRLPTSVRELLLTRLGRLSETSQKLLRAASAVRTPIDPWVLSHITNTPEDALYDQLREAVERHVLEADPDGRRFAFRHALLREAALSDVLPGERQHLHRRVAEAIESAHAQGRVGAAEASAELAFHWAESGDAGPAVAALLAAAAAATDARGFDSALDHYERALDLWDSVEDPGAGTGIDHVDLLARAAQAASLAGDDDRAIALVTSALEEKTPDTDPIGAALLHESLGVYLFNSGKDAAALDAFESALALSSNLSGSIERARILVTAGRCHMQQGHHDRARGFCEQALEQARRLGAKREEGRALNALGVMLATESRFDEGIAHLRGALAIAEELGDIEELARAYVNLGFALEISGRLRESVTTAMHGVGLARDWGLQHTWGVLLSSNAAGALFELGEWAEMVSLISSAERSARSRFDNAFVHVNAARLDAARGDFVRARHHLNEAEALVGVAGYLDLLRGVHEVNAEIAFWERRPDAALRAAMDGLDAVAHGTEHILAGRFLMLALRAAADLAQNARDRHSPADEDGAINHAWRALAIAKGLRHNPLESVRTPLPESAAVEAQSTAEVARCEGRHEPALWDAAVGLWDELERPYHSAYARWRGAEAALAVKNPASNVADELRVAHESAVRLGARPLASEIEYLARRGRISIEPKLSTVDEPAEVPPWGQFGLTDRELDVLRFVAQGLSNRDIARELFISPKTASAHVSNILRKLGVQGRGEAAAVAFRLGIVPSA